MSRCCATAGSAFLTLAISTMVRNAVSVYMDRTAGVNAYDELLAALSRPEYYSFVQSLTGSSISVFTREALATLLRVRTVCWWLCTHFAALQCFTRVAAGVWRCPA